MTVLARVASGVRTVTNNRSDLTTVVMGETGAAGQAYRVDTSNNKAYLSDANAGGIASAEFAGYLLGNAILNERVQAQIGGNIYLGVAAIQGTFYFVSATAGETEDCVAQAIGNAGQLIGYGNADGSITIKPVSSGGVIPT